MKELLENSWWCDSYNWHSSDYSHEAGQCAAPPHSISIPRRLIEQFQREVAREKLRAI
jgi:hypothetical protein